MSARTKRTRHMFKPYFIHVPRVAIGGRILAIRLKVSQVIIEDLGPVKGSKGTGEIERGSIDTEESKDGTE